MRCTAEGNTWVCDQPNTAVSDTRMRREQPATTAQPKAVKKAVNSKSAPQPQQTTTVTPNSRPTQNVTAQQCPQSAPNRNALKSASNREQAAISIDAAEMEIQGKNLFFYRGEVSMLRADQSLRTDQLTYNHEAGTLAAEGNLRYQEDGLQLTGAQALFNTQTEHASIHQARYLLENSSARGSAEQIEMDGHYVNRFHNTTYTTCPSAEDGWMLEAELIEMDELEGWGRAKNAVIRFQDTPVFYSPDYSFPLDERRKNGFLFPTWGYSQQTGADVAAPYYINLAPNRDLTLTPRAISKRGAMINGDFRYLNIDNRGDISASYLADDDLAGDSRYQLGIRHQGEYLGALANPLQYDINFTTLSDRDYLVDFGNSLALTSVGSVTQSAQLRYQQGEISLAAEVTDHYIVSDPTTIDDPYRKLPQIDLSWAPSTGATPLRYSVDAQFVKFDHDTKNGAKRYWINPSIDYTYNLQGGAAYIKPTLSIAQSHYELDEGGTINLTVPHYTVETGLFFEREIEKPLALWGGSGGYLQTLEPSLKFSYIPDGRDSGKNFDSLNESGNSTVDLSEIHGKDSAPYTQQLTWAINSDWIHTADGIKTIRASLQQTRDFKQTRTRDWGNLIAGVELEHGAHDIEMLVDWNPDASQNDTSRLNYQYDNDQGKLLNLGYIYDRSSDDLTQAKKQADLSTAWKLDSKWSLVGRYNQEMIEDDSHKLEDLVGFQYDSCCWALQFTRRNYFTGKDVSGSNQFDTSWMMLLELKGLGDIGSRQPLESLLSTSIRGYRLNQ